MGGGQTSRQLEAAPLTPRAVECVRQGLQLLTSASLSILPLGIAHHVEAHTNTLAKHKPGSPDIVGQPSGPDSTGRALKMFRRAIPHGRASTVEHSGTTLDFDGTALVANAQPEPIGKETQYIRGASGIYLAHEIGRLDVCVEKHLAVHVAQPSEKMFGHLGAILVGEYLPGKDLVEAVPGILVDQHS